MSRKPDSKIKDEILECVLSAIKEKGLNNLSLRDIARETGVSARMLIYHFESFENLINSVFIHLSIRHKDILKTILSENAGKSPGQISEIFIETIFADDNRDSLLLFLELYTRGLRDTNKYSEFYNEVLHNWISEIEKYLLKLYGGEAREYATIIVSLSRGLMLDWLATGDKKRMIKSSFLFLSLFEKSGDRRKI
jgi:AcrR family transcriptional regulator